MPAGTINRFVWTWVSPPDPDAAVQIPHLGRRRARSRRRSSIHLSPNQRSGKGKGKPDPRDRHRALRHRGRCTKCACAWRGSSSARRAQLPSRCSAVTHARSSNRTGSWRPGPPLGRRRAARARLGTDSGPEGILERAIVAHVNAAAARPPKDARTNTLVHFADQFASAALAVERGIAGAPPRRCPTRPRPGASLGVVRAEQTTFGREARPALAGYLYAGDHRRL